MILGTPAKDTDYGPCFILNYNETGLTDTRLQYLRVSMEGRSSTWTERASGWNPRSVKVAQRPQVTDQVSRSIRYFVLIFIEKKKRKVTSLYPKVWLDATRRDRTRHPLLI